MARLRDFSLTSDGRMAALPHFDARSVAYTVGALFGRRLPKPKKKTWRCRTVLNQGLEGSCVGHAFAHELLAQPKVVKGIDHAFARETIYWAAQRIDAWEGGAYPGAKPYGHGTSVISAAKVVKELGYITEYRWAMTKDQLVAAVGHLGPAVIGVPWLRGMRRPDEEGLIHATGDITGRHAVLVTGVDPKAGLFTILNSWGEQWGAKGRAKISIDALWALLKRRGEACIPLARDKDPG